MGGLAVGETQSQMLKILSETVKYMPKNKPRYLMGVGTPSDLLGAIKCGIDMFDCVLPTRSGRTGLAYTWTGKVNLRNSKYKYDKLIQLIKIATSGVLTVTLKVIFTILVKSNEMLASMLISLHNINFYQQLMIKIRKEIHKKRFNLFYRKYMKIFEKIDLNFIEIIYKKYLFRPLAQLVEHLPFKEGVDGSESIRAHHNKHLQRLFKWCTHSLIC